MTDLTLKEGDAVDWKRTLLAYWRFGPELREDEEDGKLGMLWPLIARFGLGRLPGDIVIERENFRLYIPIMTSLIVSIVLSVILWLINR